MAEFIGRSDNLLFFTSGEKGVVVDSSVNMIVASGSASVLAATADWAIEDPTDLAVELAELALISLDSSITASAGRMYTIPKAAQAEAKKALEWRKEEKRGGTPVGLNTARTLAKGGQIGIEKVRHIAKYFPRHEVDKQGKGWKPGEDNFPSNGRIAWALWGGDAAWRWAKAIVEREDKKAVTASSHTTPDVSAFDVAQNSDVMEAPEFFARVRMDGSGMDRLYKIDTDGTTSVWDDGQWDSFGDGNEDIWSIDSTLDSIFEEQFVDTTHAAIDPDSAIYIAARLYDNPTTFVTIEEIDSIESSLVAAAIDSVDWDFIDRTLVAAGEVAPAEGTPEGDGVYTEEERSANAKKQVRDGTGRFAKTGARVVVGKDATNKGVITRVNPARGTVSVKLDSGDTVEVDGKQVESADRYQEPVGGRQMEDTRIDTRGILAEPRTPINRAGAQLPGTLPAMRAEDIHSMLNNWPAWVKSQRDQFKPAVEAPSPVAVQAKNSLDKGKWGSDFEKAVGKSLTTDAYDHPLISDWLRKTNPDGTTPNKLWYAPITAAGVVKELTPQTSDVQPVYMAIVDADDPRAVLSLVSLIPANDKSTAPMTYVRQQGKWVRDPRTLADLQSATPPPVVPLDSKTLDIVLQQVDETQGVTASIALTVLFGNDSIVAAGGADRNRGNAEKLRRYWVHGAGAAKIRWGQGGDWKRCVRLLSKHMGVRAKGYCQLRHKEALGYYTSTHAKMDRAKNNSIESVEENVIAVPNEDGSDEMSMTEVTREDMQTPLRSIIEETEGEEDGWEPDEDIVIILANPEALDEEEFALIAAGGADRNRGQAEELRKYWTVGKGAAKIRWGTPGDWTRCYRLLGKYMGVRAKGYCALRHKEMNAIWPGEHNKKEFVTNQFGTPTYTDEMIRSEDRIVEMSVLAIKSEGLKARVAGAYGFVNNKEANDVPVDSFFFHGSEDMQKQMEELLDTLEPVDTQDIAIEDLIPTQQTINMKKVQSVVGSEKPVKVLITEDGPLLVDGHHRTVAHMLMGKDTVPAHIYKIEEDDNDID